MLASFRIKKNGQVRIVVERSLYMMEFVVIVVRVFENKHFRRLKIVTEKKVGASDFLALGLYAFAGFGLEIILSMILPAILGAQSSQYTLINQCIHWTLTCILWGTMVVFLMSLSKKKYHFDILKFNEAPNVKQWVLALVIVIIAITVTTIVWGGFKPIKEYRNMTESIFQTVYYLFETALILLTIIFGQKFGEMMVKKHTFPFGGLFLALTWGLVHILLQGPMTGLYAFVMSLLYGTVYILLRKNYKYSFTLIAIIFIV